MDWWNGVNTNEPLSTFPAPGRRVLDVATDRRFFCLTMYIHQDVDTSGHWHDGQSPPALQADCSASLEVHAWALVRAPCLLYPQETRQSITVMPSRSCMYVNSDALVLGSWQMHHIHTSRQSARNYSKRCTVLNLMHPCTRRCLGVICAKQNIHLRVPLPPGHLDACLACLAQIAHSHRRVRALDQKA